MKRFSAIALKFTLFLLAANTLIGAGALETRPFEKTNASSANGPKYDSGEILVEVLENVENSAEWPETLGTPDRSFVVSQFALFGLPQKYGSLGERLSYQGPLIVRMTGRVDFHKASPNILTRTNGMSRLSVDGQLLLEVEAVPQSRDAHGRMRPPANPNLPYPRARLGTQDSTQSIQTYDGPQRVTLESLIDCGESSTPLYEMLLAIQNKDGGLWSILDPEASKQRPFTFESLNELRKEQLRYFEAQNLKSRMAAQSNLKPYWESRHSKARKYVQSLPEIKPAFGKINFRANNVIDQFIEAKISKRNAESKTERFDRTFHEEIWPILEENCFRCHGKKSKGGLKLDSLEAALKGGESGSSTIAPGKPEESELILRIGADDENDRMPFEEEPLTTSEIQALRRWILEGAQWTAASDIIEIPDKQEELPFLRRIYLDTVGVIPTTEEIRKYRADTRTDKKARLIDRLLNDPRHADHWVPYWQDVLAENPSLMKPTLNNSGPFRYWIHESLLDNKPFDQFVTELVTFQGDPYAGGAAGFGLATQNDSPVAAKAHIIGTAFLGVEMKCARCHDSPNHSSTQKDLFSIAAMLNGSPVKVPSSSTVPETFFERLADRKPHITKSLHPETSVDPVWPFAEWGNENSGQKKTFNSSTVELAWHLTRLENPRFARVIVNRIWKRYFGQGFVEPAFDWEGNDPSHPDLLVYLARDFVANGYNLKRLSRLILNSGAYSREPIVEGAYSPVDRFFEAPVTKRMSAEQLVDSLFHSVGVPMFSEELTLDVEGFWPEETFENYGFPHRAWEFVSTSTERERASLTLPLVNEIVSLMSVYGWRPNRAEPITERELDPDVFQSGFLANSSLGLWLFSLSDYSTLTSLAHETKSVEELVDELYLRFLTRLPYDQEKTDFVGFLRRGFERRIIDPEKQFVPIEWIPEIREVSWSNHLSVEANYHVAEKVERLLKGPKPTQSLNKDWRERMEDVVWVLVNTPEFQYLQ